MSKQDIIKMIKLLLYNGCKFRFILIMPASDVRLIALVKVSEFTSDGVDMVELIQLANPDFSMQPNKYSAPEHLKTLRGKNFTLVSVLSLSLFFRHLLKIKRRRSAALFINY